MKYQRSRFAEVNPAQVYVYENRSQVLLDKGIMLRFFPLTFTVLFTSVLVIELVVLFHHMINGDLFLRE